MTMAHPSAIAVHVEAAKRLLRDLEQHADAARQALGHEGGEEFFAAVNERDRILGQLGAVVDALTTARHAPGESAGDDAETSALVAELAQATAAALDSHDRLEVETRRERDRLGVALRRTVRPDAVAHRYAASNGPRSRRISITG
jgi:hypothetical protein